MKISRFYYFASLALLVPMLLASSTRWLLAPLAMGFSLGGIWLWRLGR